MSTLETAVPPTMILSDRVNSIKPSATLAVSARVKVLKAEGVDVIGFGAGEPDFDTPDNIKQVAIDALMGGKTGYAPVPGDPKAREVIAEKLRTENGIDCTSDDIVISTGAKQSLYLALQCLLDPGKGQQVVIPEPAWVSYFTMVQLAGGDVVDVPCGVEADFKITPAQLENAINANTRAFLINNPSNPCGTMYSPDEIRALGEVLAAHEHIAIISDEIYEKLVYGDTTCLSLGSLPALAHRTITINGLSKAYAMTGWRIGYACWPGPSKGAKAISKLQGQMTTSAVTFCAEAISEALTGSADSVEDMRKTFAKRAELIHGLVKSWPNVKCPPPTGAFYVFPDISASFGTKTPEGRSIDSALTFAEALLEEAKVAVVPGEDFGAVGKGHVRLSFACSEANIEEGCRRIGKWLATLK